MGILKCQNFLCCCLWVLKSFDHSCCSSLYLLWSSVLSKMGKFDFMQQQSCFGAIKWHNHVFSFIFFSFLKIPNVLFAFLSASEYQDDVFMVLSVITPRWLSWKIIATLGSVTEYLQLKLLLHVCYFTFIYTEFFLCVYCLIILNHEIPMQVLAVCLPFYYPE